MTASRCTPRRFPSPGWLLAGAGLGLALLCCGGSGGGSAPPSGGGISGQVINVGTSGGLVFDPPNLTVKAGTPVTFVWLSSGHSVTSGSNCAPDGKFGGTTLMAQGQTLSVPTTVVNVPGSYPFYCTSHCGQNMKGTLTVTP
ncbi:MAG: plastocyanin/azurin family copper-binding protein [Holophagaceae bacterium]